MTLYEWVVSHADEYGPRKISQLRDSWLFSRIHLEGVHKPTKVEKRRKGRMGEEQEEEEEEGEEDGEKDKGGGA